MKQLKDSILEKLIINKNSKIERSHNIELDSCDKIINNWKEFNEIDDKKVFDTNILSFIHSYIKKYPAYIWEYTLDDKKRDKELTDLIKRHRKYNNIDNSTIMDPKSIAGDNGVAVILTDKDTKYSEIYVTSRNIIPIKHYIILQDK